MNAYSGAGTPANSPQLRSALRWSPQSWSSSSWRLFWKEFRQVLPLLWALLAVGTLLQLIGAIQSAINPSASGSGLHQIALVLMPSLFAVGAGAMLVSQEKELRTLQWLSSLPIPTKQIVWTKFLCGLVGLLLCWAGSCLIAFALCPECVRRSNQLLFLLLGERLGNAVLHQLTFSFGCKYGHRWIFKSAWVALVMMVPIAIVPVYSVGHGQYKKNGFGRQLLRSSSIPLQLQCWL